MWDRECIHGLLQSMSPVNDAFHALPYHTISVTHGRVAQTPSPLQTRLRDFSLLITPFPCARLNCGSWRTPFNAKFGERLTCPHICSTVTAGAASRSVPFSLRIRKTSRAARGTVERASTLPRSDSKPCYGCLCPAQHRFTSVNLCC